MLRIIRLAAILSVSSFAILALPLAGGSLDLPGVSAMAAKGGNGGGGGGDSDSGGGGGGHSSESHGNSGESHGSSAKSGGSTKSSTAATTQSSGGKKSTAPKGASTDVTVASKKAPVPAVKKSAPELSERNFNAQLAGLNSLKRNANGLLNSSDPRMEGIRAYVEAGAALDVAIEELAKATLDLKNAEDAYQLLLDGLVLEAYDDDPEAYPDISIGGLDERRTELLALALPADHVDYDAWQAEIASLDLAIGSLQTSQELADLEAAKLAFDGADDAFNTAEAAAGDDALKGALLLAANDNRVAQYGDEYVTDEILAWAKSVLGVEDVVEAAGDPLIQQ